MSRRQSLVADGFPRQLLGVELLEGRIAPANLQLTATLMVDASNTAQANPVFGQMVYVRANWASQAMTGAEPSVPVRYTVNGRPADSSAIYHGSGSGTWNWYRGGWYAGVSAFSVTVTLDPDNQIAETNESDNSTTFLVTPVAPTNLPSKFLTPIGKTANDDWAINNYADIDPGAGVAADYRGGPYNYDGHDAIDAGPWGFDSQDAGIPIYAAADGVVTQVLDGQFDRQTATTGAQGNYVRIAHGNQWDTLYYHFAKDSITVRVGDSVKAGQVIGLMGSSGNSTGTHLHYTAYYRDCQVEAGFSPSTYWVSPLPYGGDLAPFTFAAGVTNYVPDPDGGEKVSPIGAVPTSGSGTLYFWVQTYNLKTTDVLTWRWKRPDGTVYATNTFSPGQNYRFSWWYWSRALSNFQSVTGTWNVEYLINGTVRETVPFTVSAAGEPSLRTTNPSGQILIDGRTTPQDFGSVAQFGAAPQQSYTVRNHGYGNLTLSNFSVPPGFTLVAAPSTLAAGVSGTVTVRMDTAVVGAKFGTLRFDTNDPDVGTYEVTLSGTVTGTPVAGAPVIDPDGNASLAVSPSLMFNSQSLARPLSPSATVTGGPSFTGGSLRAEFASFGDGNDRLAVRNQGTGAGQIGVSGSTVTFGGTAVGTFTGGVGTAPLVVTLNASATTAAVQALVRNLTYQTLSATPTTQRKSVRYTLTDAAGRVGNLAVQHVVNTGIARNPVVATLPAQTVVRGTSLTRAGSFSDPSGFAWTATVDYGDGSGVQPLTLNADKTFTLSHVYVAAAGTYSVTVTVVNDFGGVTTAVMPVTVVAPLGVASVAVNGGSPQRSMVTEIVVTFTGLVTLPANPATAFEVLGPGGAVTLAVDLSSSTPTQTVARITFLSGTEYGSLTDGLYTLRVKGNLIQDASGAAVDADGDGLAGGERVDSFHRLFGDINGDGFVDGTDESAFGSGFGLSSTDAGWALFAAFDFNGDGFLDGTDESAFGSRFGLGL